MARSDWLTRLLHRLPAEIAHDLALTGLHRASALVPSVRLSPQPGLEAEHMGLRFAHPVCLAAGFDKNAKATRGLRRFGFAGMEVGSITCAPQPGNSKPRLFRLSEVSGLINRMGFNSDGLDTARSHLARRDRSFVVGVNLGLNKGLVDYEAQLRSLTRALAAHADYFTVNLSSPNTPGLRSLLEPSHVAPILSAVRAGLSDAGLERPVVMKLSPDMDPPREAELLSYLAGASINGVIAGNTTVDRAMLPAHLLHRGEVGGLSGSPLAEKSRALLARVFAAMPSGMTIIASGGISTGQDIYERLSSGAHLVQIYTAFTYGGRQTVPRLLDELRRAMALAGVGHLGDIWIRNGK